MNKLRQITFGIFFLFLLSPLPAFSQENKCNLKIKVLESEDAISIIQVDLTVRNLKSDVSFNNEGQISEFVFFNLSEGDYEIVASKENFKLSVDKFSLACKDFDRDGYKVKVIVLRAGDSREKVETDDRDSVNQPGVLKVIPRRGSDTERLKKFEKINNLLNSYATYLGKPDYPKAAKAVKAAGVVFVQITIDEEGKVESAQAISGHPLLRAATAEAAKNSKFKPTIVAGKPVKVTGLLVYNFTL